MKNEYEDDPIDLENEPVYFSQPSLCAAILTYLGKCGIATVNQRQMNAVVAGATMVYDALQNEHVPAAPASGLATWLKSDDTGMSSMYLAFALVKASGKTWSVRVPEEEYPRDPDDFGRCVRMLGACPHLREFIPAMADGHGKKWAALAREWDKLEALYLEELPTGGCPNLYALMKEIGL